MGRFRRAALLVIAVLAAATVVQAAAAAAPTAITGTVSAVGGTSATLNGTVNPGGAATDWWFEYGTSTSYGSKSATTAAGSGSANVAVSKALSGAQSRDHVPLPARRKERDRDHERRRRAFHDRIASGRRHRTCGGHRPDDGDARRHGEPERRAHHVVRRIRNLGLVRQQDADDRCRSGQHLESGLGRRHGPRRPGRPTTSASSRRARQGRCRVPMRPSSPPSRPAATTSAASSLSSTGATLNGKVDANGRATTYVFEYGTTTSYGTKTPSSSAGSGSNAVNVSKAVTGLKSGVDLSLPAVATSDAGSVTGADQAFTTHSAPDRRHGAGDRRRPDLGDARRHREPPTGASTSW